MIHNVLTTQQEEIHLVVDGEFFDVWNGDHDVRVAAKLLTFCLNISKCS